jgi:hypothetical protein
LCAIRIFGYKLADGRLRVVPKEAEIVRAVFSDYLSGMGATAIAKKLRSGGLKASYRMVFYMLRNEKYAGNLLLQKRHVPDHLTKKAVLNRGELPQYWVDGSHEAIVDPEIFQRVQEEIARRAKTISNPQSSRYPYTGLIVCGRCGRRYKRKINSAGTKYAKAVWSCSTFERYGKQECPSQQIPESILKGKTEEALAGRPFSAIKEIRIPAHNRLVFVFHDGTEKEIHWKNPSRSESWTPEMRDKARQRNPETNRAH